MHGPPNQDRSIATATAQWQGDGLYLGRARLRFFNACPANYDDGVTIGALQMGDAVGAGYLARVEANQVGIRAAPGLCVFLRLTRAFPREGQTTSMFTEMTPGHVLHVHS